MSFALLRAAGLAAAAVIALPSGSWAQQPYQSHANGPYKYSIRAGERAPSIPVVYMAWDGARGVEDNVYEALVAFSICDRDRFQAAIQKLRNQDKQLGDHGESLLASDPQQARVWINDTNTVASLINWLIAMSWKRCNLPSSPVPVTSRAAYYEIKVSTGANISALV